MAKILNIKVDFIKDTEKTISTKDIIINNSRTADIEKESIEAAINDVIATFPASTIVSATILNNLDLSVAIDLIPPV